MSKEVENSEAKPTQAHGTLRSYISGFLLSLVFTLIPYYLVVNKNVEGTALLATILGFAVLQLIVQVVFFLHLGREKKPRFNLFFLVSTIGIILVVVGGSIWIMNHLHYNMSAKDIADKVSTDEAVYRIDGQQVGTCSGTGTNHTIELKNNAVDPRRIEAKLCDTITFINLDDMEHTIVFGTAVQLERYAGEARKTVRAGRNTVLTLTELGTHRFHDSLLGEISGGFTVVR